MKSIKILTSIAMLSAAFTSCTDTSHDGHNHGDSSKTDTVAQVLNPILENIDTPKFVFSINPQRDTMVVTPSETEISIPAGTFVDASGKDVSSAVKLAFKEIRSAADIIINQVDMKYDSAGVAYDFQTAGMYELTASADGNPIFIKKGKALEVSFLTQTDEDFNFYAYKGDNWEISKESTKKIWENKTRDASNNIDFKAVKPVKVNPSADLVIDTKVDYKHLPELAVYKRIMWKYVGKDDPNAVKRLLKNSITKAKLTNSKSNTYDLDFELKDGSKHTITIAPVFAAKEFESAVKVYNSVSNKGNQTSQLRRVTRVTDLGLMNYDRIYHRPDAEQVLASFQINDNGTLISSENIPIFHITGKDDVVVPQGNKKDLFFSRKLSNKIVAILPGNRIAVLNNKDFFKKVSTRGTAADMVFELKVIETKVTSPSDLDQIIATL